ncbi:uncharacterized protein BX664DRAFT_325602 [Halteromyces radiatus]|uniref:uncharacterized protein n=1 Tax=Halteromyces radiatus TaxID=101107 RepID=UPI002220933F|nr:uncharacterized protein BX664DRAFT_325602 [Halteromyces radiatus]KAI8097119.1 hypothetical protein BX664DRAFT_325602 [Halteromyces radiatus]
MRSLLYNFIPLVTLLMIDNCYSADTKVKYYHQYKRSSVPPVSKPTVVIVNRQEEGIAQQLNNLDVVTLTSNFIVTQTSTYYSISSSITTIDHPSTTSLAIGNNNNGTSTTSSDTTILVGSLVGGLSGLILIGTLVFLHFIRVSPDKLIDGWFLFFVLFSLFI